MRFNDIEADGPDAYALAVEDAAARMANGTSDWRDRQLVAAADAELLRTTNRAPAPTGGGSSGAAAGPH